MEKAKGSTALLCPLCRAPMYGPAPPFLCKPVTNDAVRFIVDCRFCCWSFGRVTRKAVGSVPLPFCNLLRSFIKLFYDYTLATNCGPQYNAFMVDDQETEARRRRQRLWKGAKGATSSHPGPSGVNGLICDLVSIGSHPAWEPIEQASKLR